MQVGEMSGARLLLIAHWTIFSFSRCLAPVSKPVSRVSPPLSNASQGQDSGHQHPGYCSATCVERASLQAAIKQPEPRTSDLFVTCNLPKRFEHPHWFNGYGCQVSKQHPFYRTSASEYGWYPPGIHSVPSVFFPAGQTFTNRLAAAGMYRNYSLNTGMDPASYP